MLFNNIFFYIICKPYKLFNTILFWYLPKKTLHHFNLKSKCFCDIRTPKRVQGYFISHRIFSQEKQFVSSGWMTDVTSPRIHNHPQSSLDWLGRWWFVSSSVHQFGHSALKSIVRRHNLQLHSYD